MVNLVIDIAKNQKHNYNKLKKENLWNHLVEIEINKKMTNSYYLTIIKAIIIIVQ